MANQVPFLIEPSWVFIESVNTNDTMYDDLMREEIGLVARDEPIKVKAQIIWGRTDSAQQWLGGQGGVSDEATGHLVFLERDLRRRGITLKQGDKVTTMAGYQGEVFLKNKLMAGHRNSSPGIEIWDFIDHPLFENRNR